MMAKYRSILKATILITLSLIAVVLVIKISLKGLRSSISNSQVNLIKKAEENISEENLLKKVSDNPKELTTRFNLAYFYLFRAMETKANDPGRGYTDLLKKARDQFEDILVIDSSFLDAQKGLGKTYLVEGDNNRALEIYLAALGRKPDDFEALYSTGLIYRRIGENEKSLEYLTNAKIAGSTVEDIEESFEYKMLIRMLDDETCLP